MPDKHRQLRIIDQDSHLLHLLQGPGNLLQRLAGKRHEFIGVDALVGLGLKKVVEDCLEFGKPALGEFRLHETRLRFFKGERSAGGKDTRLVFFTAQKITTFQPSDGRHHLGFGITIFCRESRFDSCIQQNLAGRNNQLSSFAL
ncbi:hypothetical protein D3C85_1035750 [compost metagenome]